MAVADKKPNDLIPAALETTGGATNPAAVYLSGLAVSCRTLIRGNLAFLSTFLPN